MRHHIGTGAIDALSVGPKPHAYILHHIALLLWESAIGHWSKIEQHLSVVAHHLNEFVYDVDVRAAVYATHIAPRLVVTIADGVVAQPGYGVDVFGIAHLVVKHTDASGKFLVFVGEYHLLPRLFSMVEIMGKKLQFLLFGDGIHPCVKINDVGTVIAHHLLGLVKPHLIPFFTGHQATVHLGILGIVGRPCGFHLDIIVVVFMVQRHEELHATTTHGIGHLAHHIPLGAHGLGIERRKLGVPHRETVVMFTHHSGKACPTALEQFGPLVGIESLSLEHRDEVVVAKLLQRPIHRLMTLAGIHQSDTIVVHIVKILFVAISRHAVHSPMAVNAKLGIAHPFGHGLMLFQRFPCGFVMLLCPQHEHSHDQGQ